MKAKRKTSELEIHSPDALDRSLPLGDLRFRALLSDEEWNRLPRRVQDRFSKRLTDGTTAVYVGNVDSTEFIRLGWWLAQAARAIGAPLPTAAYENTPSIVTVTEDVATSGQIWTRIYARRVGFPQVIHSSKRFGGPTGLEEFIGFGLSIALKVSTDERSLIFRSTDYFWHIGAFRLRLPAWATPGSLTVKHIDRDRGTFEFSLEVVHPRFGSLIKQTASFREATP